MLDGLNPRRAMDQPDGPRVVIPGGATSETPILDREVPLPPRAAPGSGLAPVLAVWLGLVGLVGACLILGRPPILRQWLLVDLRHWIMARLTGDGIVMFCVAALAAYYAMIAVHELGHVFAGLGVGFRLRSLRVGPLVFTPPFGVSLYWGPGALLNGVASLTPVATDHLAGRGVVMLLGGPAANLVPVIFVPLLPDPMPAFAGLFLAFSLANALSDLLPFESRLGVSDGCRIGMLLRQRARGERWLALLHLGGASNDGVLPESLSAGFLGKAIALRDESADTVIAHAMAYAAAFHQRKDGEAGQLLETCLRYSGHAAPVVRAGLMSDAAVFQARRRKRVDLAEQWLAAIPASTQPHWFRLRAEAAVLEGKGDAGGALGKLAEVEAAVLASPRNPQGETILRLLQRWKSDLRGA